MSYDFLKISIVWHFNVFLCMCVIILGKFKLADSSPIRSVSFFEIRYSLFLPLSSTNNY